MSFSLFAVRTGEEPQTDLYPDPGDARDSVELEDGDGRVAVYTVTAMSVTSLAGNRPQQTAKFADISATATVTDRRVAVACTKYDKGGGWSGFGVGGLAVAATANAVSKARAARRRKGKMLVGHVRYDWLGVIEAKDRSGVFTKNGIQLLFGDPAEGSGLLVLDLTLDKHASATTIAADIARRAAAYKATHNADGDHRAALHTYAGSPTFEALDNGTRRYRLPATVS